MSDYEHLRLIRNPGSHRYSPRGGGRGGKYSAPPRDRIPHADRLLLELRQTQADAAARGLLPSDPVSMTFELPVGAIDVLKSLEDAKSHITLLNATEDGKVLRATVSVPPGGQAVYEGKLNEYKTEDTKKSGKPKHQELVQSIDTVHLASIRELWTDAARMPEAQEELWWEVWLQAATGQREVVRERFTEAASKAGFKINPRALEFPDRVVVLARGSQANWARDARLFIHVAELRRAKPANAGYTHASPAFQRELIDDFRERLIPPDVNAPAVCLLDTGIAHEHPLLCDAIDAADAETVDPAWGTADRHPQRHGTTMAGIALYGSLVDAFELGIPIELAHRLESVKILPHDRENEPDSYGNITQEAMARIESLRPRRVRVFSLAVTADCRDGGLPSSWSAALDQACAGEDGTSKLVCVSAGNLREQIHDASFEYPMTEDPSCGVEDPGQAWNVLTIGAMTERVDPGAEWTSRDYCAIAPAGDLSPTSRVSLAWPEEVREQWPHKPDIVMEGGNWAKGPGERCPTDDLGLLTTTLLPTGRLLTITHDTSPATAAAARLGARIFARYPNLRPETVRGLMVHSARWTGAMERRFPGATKGTTQTRLRCFGFGVPDERRALYSAENYATMIFEGQLTPYRRHKGEIKNNEMHVHELPWPNEVLEQLSDAPVRLRVTLSYFVEPSPGRRGWKLKHRYASHGLRFDVSRRTESEEQFLTRVSAASRDDEDASAAEDSSSSEPLPWIVGPKGRTRGSLHSDWCETTAAELLLCNKIAVFPVTGWWRERRHLDRWASRAPYSLIVSLETDAEDVHLYTEIKTSITQAIVVGRK